MEEKELEMKRISLPSLLWYGNEPREITFPERWQVDLLEPPGFRKPEITEEEMARAFAYPIGSPTMEELAVGANEVVIVFDDITRPTPVSKILPFVLRPLEKAGVPDSNIRFIPALGTHGAMNNIDYRKKLGEEVVERFAIYNHNPYENCDYLGNTKSGMPVYVNREFNSCDLRIGIGCITPHVHLGFGGGGKLILPGICGIETIHYFHSQVIMRDPQSCGLGKFEGNVMYREVEEVARMSGLQLKIDALINGRGEITELFVGDPVKAHLAGVEVAKEHYGTSLLPGRDIVVANAYAKYNEMAICMLMALTTVNFARGTIVLLVDAPEGQVCHYLMRSFGKNYGGRVYIPRGAPPETVKVIVCSKYPDRTMCDLFAPIDTVTLTREWEETLALLEEEYPGEAAVAVIPDGTMQYFAEG
jgi:nickel-dependent lactate racemase